MARRRKKSAHKSKAHSHKGRRRRRSLKGLAGLGAMTSPKAIHGALPGLVASLVTAGVTIGLRIALTKGATAPAADSMQAKAIKYAPAIGAGAGLIASGAFLATSGASAATSAALVSLASAGALMASDKLLASDPAVRTLVFQESAPAGVSGLGAIVPETNLGAILMERNRGGLIGMGATVPHAGEIVNLQGTINPSAFGQ